MVRHIVAVDKRNGIAKNGKIPWHLEGDSKYFLDHVRTLGSRVLVAAKTHAEIGRPIADYTYVWSHRDFEVERGQIVHDLRDFFRSFQGELWVIGGASLYEATLGFADELYVTRIEKDYACDRFYPQDLTDFTRVSHSQHIVEHGTIYSYEVYSRNNPAKS